MGSCCLVGVIWKGTLLIAHLGVCRAVIGTIDRSNKIIAVPLTVDHNVNIEEIRREVSDAHPNDNNLIVFRNNALRIKGVVQVCFCFYLWKRVICTLVASVFVEIFLQYILMTEHVAKLSNVCVCMWIPSICLYQKWYIVLWLRSFITFYCMIIFWIIRIYGNYNMLIIVCKHWWALIRDLALWQGVTLLYAYSFDYIFGTMKVIFYSYIPFLFTSSLLSVFCFCN